MARSNAIRLELRGFNPNNKSGESKKYWEGWTHGSNFVAHWGRIGTDGQVRSWNCGSSFSAESKMREKVASKQSKGYVVV